MEAPQTAPTASGAPPSMTATLNMRPHLTGAIKDPYIPPHGPKLAPPPLKPNGPPSLGFDTPVRHNSSGMMPEKFSIPLSARRAEPLDMSTVERRGQATEVKDSQDPSRPHGVPSRPHGLQEALTFRPTEEEFRNPMEYIKKIAPTARPYGICKIIPPDNWNPDFAIDTEVRGFENGRLLLRHWSPSVAWYWT